MYNKLFAKILDSSIWLEPTNTRIVWLTLLAAMDEDGIVQFASVANLAARARVPLSAAEKAVACLESPDSNSGDPDNDGRRVERVPGGWLVLNAVKYRVLVTRTVAREQTRERVKQFKDRKRDGVDLRIAAQDKRCDCCGELFQTPFSLYVVQDHNHGTGEQRGLICQSCNKCVGLVEAKRTITVRDSAKYVAYVNRWNAPVTQVTQVTQTVTPSEAVSEAVSEERDLDRAPRARTLPVGFEMFWAAYPKHVAKDAAVKAWVKRRPDSELVAAIVAAVETQKAWPSWRDGYVPNPATWLNAGRWTDEPPTNGTNQPRERQIWVCRHVDECDHRAMCELKNEMPHKYPPKVTV